MSTSGQTLFFPSVAAYMAVADDEDLPLAVVKDFLKYTPVIGVDLPPGTICQTEPVPACIPNPRPLGPAVSLHHDDRALSIGFAIETSRLPFGPHRTASLCELLSVGRMGYEGESGAVEPVDPHWPIPNEPVSGYCWLNFFPDVMHADVKILNPVPLASFGQVVALHDVYGIPFAADRVLRITLRGSYYHVTREERVSNHPMVHTVATWIDLWRYHLGPFAGFGCPADVPLLGVYTDSSFRGSQAARSAGATWVDIERLREVLDQLQACNVGRVVDQGKAQNILATHFPRWKAPYAYDRRFPGDYRYFVNLDEGPWISKFQALRAAVDYTGATVQPQTPPTHSGRSLTPADNSDAASPATGISSYAFRAAMASMLLELSNGDASYDRDTFEEQFGVRQHPLEWRHDHRRRRSSATAVGHRTEQHDDGGNDDDDEAMFDRHGKQTE